MSFLFNFFPPLAPIPKGTSYGRPEGLPLVAGTSFGRPEGLPLVAGTSFGRCADFVKRTKKCKCDIG